MQEPPPPPEDFVLPTEPAAPARRCPTCKSREVSSEPGAQGETYNKCGGCGFAWVTL